MAELDDREARDRQASALDELVAASGEARAALDPEVIEREARASIDREAIEREAREAQEREGHGQRHATGHRPADRGPDRFYEQGEGQRHVALGFIVVVGVIAVAVIALIVGLGFGCSVMRG